MLAVANCQVELKDVRGARKTLTDLAAAYPQAEAAQAAVTAHAKAAGLSRYTVEMAVKKAVRHTEAAED